MSKKSEAFDYSDEGTRQRIEEFNRKETGQYKKLFVQMLDMDKGTISIGIMAVDPDESIMNYPIKATFLARTIVSKARRYGARPTDEWQFLEKSEQLSIPHYKRHFSFSGKPVKNG